MAYNHGNIFNVLCDCASKIPPAPFSRGSTHGCTVFSVFRKHCYRDYVPLQVLPLEKGAGGIFSTMIHCSKTQVINPQSSAIHPYDRSSVRANTRFAPTSLSQIDYISLISIHRFSRADFTTASSTSWHFTPSTKLGLAGVSFAMACIRL